MRLIDADRLREEIERLKSAPETVKSDLFPPNYLFGVNVGLSMAQKCLFDTTTIAPPPNEPLTVDELREMDGEPVWWEDKYGRSGWGLVSVDPECVVIVIAHDQNFVAAVRGEMNIPFVVGIYRRKPDAKEDA